MASTSRMLARNWLPRPSPWLAPRTRPAMSTNSICVSMVWADLAMAAGPAEGLRAYARAGFTHVQIWLEPSSLEGIEAFGPLQV